MVAVSSAWQYRADSSAGQRSVAAAAAAVGGPSPTRVLASRRRQTVEGVLAGASVAEALVIIENVGRAGDFDVQLRGCRPLCSGVAASACGERRNAGERLRK